MPISNYSWKYYSKVQHASAKLLMHYRDSAPDNTMSITEAVNHIISIFKINTKEHKFATSILPQLTRLNENTPYSEVSEIRAALYCLLDPFLRAQTENPQFKKFLEWAKVFLTVDVFHFEILRSIDLPADHCTQMLNEHRLKKRHIQSLLSRVESEPIRLFDFKKANAKQAEIDATVTTLTEQKQAQIKRLADIILPNLPKQLTEGEFQESCQQQLVLASTKFQETPPDIRVDRPSLEEINLRICKVIQSALDSPLTPSKLRNIFSKEQEAREAWNNIYNKLIDNNNYFAGASLDSVIKQYSNTDITQLILSYMSSEFGVDDFRNIHYNLKKIIETHSKPYSTLAYLDASVAAADTDVAKLETLLARDADLLQTELAKRVEHFNHTVAVAEKLRDKIAENAKLIPFLKDYYGRQQSMENQFQLFSHSLNTSTEVIETEVLEEEIKKQFDYTFTYIGNKIDADIISYELKSNFEESRWQHETKLAELKELLAVVKAHNEIANQYDQLVKDYAALCEIGDNNLVLDSFARSHDEETIDKIYHQATSFTVSEIFQTRESVLLTAYTQERNDVICDCTQKKQEIVKKAVEVLSVSKNQYQERLQNKIYYVDFHALLIGYRNSINEIQRLLPSEHNDFLASYPRNECKVLWDKRDKLEKIAIEIQTDINKKIQDYHVDLVNKCLDPLLKELESSQNLLSNFNKKSSLTTNPVAKDAIAEITTKYEFWYNQCSQIKNASPNTIEALNENILQFNAIKKNMQNQHAQITEKLDANNMSRSRLASESVSAIWHKIKINILKLLRYTDIPDYTPRRKKALNELNNAHTLWSKEIPDYSCRIETEMNPAATTPS